nr:septal ring lytic transglycosylase RlpA family protein [Oxalobacter paraformigenes]
MSGKNRKWLVLTAMLASACALILSGCGTTPDLPGKTASAKTGKVKTKKGGGYYLDDGPMDEVPDNLLDVPDAEPRVEKLARGPNKPYVVFGQSYVPMTQMSEYRKRGIGSWYGKKFHGQKTSSGEPYDMFKMTAAHPTLPIPSYARVTSLETGKQVIVRVNDRGPFLSNRLIDLSYTAAYKLGYLEKGSGQVEVELLLPDEIERINLAKKDASSPIGPQPVVIAAASEGGDRTKAAPPAANVSQPDARGTKTASGGPAYYLQLGAYQEASNAQSYQAKFSLDWAHKLPSLEVVQSGNFYKLFAGPFNTLAEATQAVQEMRSMGTNSFVVRR